MSRFASPFAFLGRSAAASDDDDKDDRNKSKSKAEDKDDDEDDKKDKDKKDEDAKSKKAKAEDGDKDDDDDKKKKKDDDQDDDKAKGKKAKASDDEDDESDASSKKARARERGRIRAILTSDAGQTDPVAAAHVALDTAMPRAEAIGMLTAMSVSRAASGGSAPARAGLGDRMGGVKNPDVGADAGQSGGPSMADRIIAAGKKARGEA